MFSNKFCCLAVAAIVFTLACKKGSIQQVDNGCISRIQRDYADPNKTELAAALKLLTDNHIATNNIVVTRVILNDTITTNGPVHVYQHVIVQQYANGLPILFAQLGYHFNNGVYDETSGYPYGTVTLGTTAHTSLPQLRYLFVQAALKDSYSVNKKITDSCLVAEFGYYDIGNSIGINPHGNLIKAWRVTPPHSDYPVAIIRDDNTELLSYFNGIFTLDKAKH